MTAPSLKLIALATCMCVLAACRTPQPAIDQANNGAALTLSLQAELARMRAVQARLAALRVERVRRQQALMAEFEAASAFDERVRIVIGDTAEQKLLDDLRMLSDSRAQDEQELATTLATLDANMARVLLPVPDQNGRLAATQAAMASLGAQLSLEQRARIIAGFASDLKKAIDKHQQAVEAATSARPVPLQDGPAGAAAD